MTRHRFIFGLGCLILLCGQAVSHDPRYRTPIRIPDIPGYKTLKCDFHTHTVFSDGAVWPDIRSEEAWREGLDAVAITEHIEYQPHKEDLPTNHERSFEIAKPHGDRLDVIVIKGSEVTRDMPPGHLNAVFLEQAGPLDTEPWSQALEEAHSQGAFIFWNHPGWDGQQSDGVARWYPEHTDLVEKGQLRGIEVINAREYYPEAHRWCLEKNLTILANSDIHWPLNLDYDVRQGDKRPVTLVFAEERSAEGIKKALFARRTAAYAAGMLIGKEEFLGPIFEASVEVLNSSVELRGTRPSFVRIHNHSEIDFELTGASSFVEISAPDELVLRGESTVLLQIRSTSRERSGSKSFRLGYSVDNLKLTPDRTLSIAFPIEVTFVPEPEE